MRFTALLARAAALLMMLACAVILRPGLATAQGALQPLLQEHRADLAKPSRQTIGPVIADLLASDHPGMADFLRKWEAREVYLRPEDGLFFYAEDAGDTLRLIDIDSGAAVAEVGSRDVDQIRPNAGVRRELAAALVPFELSAADPARRADALEAITRSADESQIAPLRDSIEGETDPALKTRKERLLTLLIAQFGATGRGLRRPAGHAPRPR